MSLRCLFHRLHEWATRNPVTRFLDPILGELTINESSWECTVQFRTRSIILRVGGRYEPDPACIETARQAFQHLDTFVDRVTDYLKCEAEQAMWRQFVDEINDLTIHDVNYWWPRKPKAGMIFFDGPDDCKLWHCDIDGSRLYGLAFDS